jgi:hypothetical protein
VGASSGLIIAFVVAVWAAYFVPLVLRRYDEAGKNASVDDAGSTGRVIAPPPADEPVATPESSAKPTTLDRPAARLAARRRRRTLLTLLALLAIVTALAAASIVPWLGVTAPAVLIAAWLVACRVQVRGELGISRPRERSTSSSSAAAASDEEETIVVSDQFEDVDPARPHVMESAELEVDSLDDQIVIAVPSVSTSGEALWDPLPVTLPTYVTKPRAGRTVRTIDFTKPGAWTSGHIEGENETLPQREEAAPAAQERRAVGS